MSITMNQNIVCFGPTNSGKSTLAGYLSSYRLNNELYEKKIQMFRAEYGNYFNERNTLSYFVDTGKDEYRVQQNTPGTSKRKHILEIPWENGLTYTLIDTPGTDKRWRNNFQNIYLGDIGLFIIEINTLLDICTNYLEGSYEYDEILTKLLTPVSLWENYGRLDRLIIVISKMDLCEYSRYSLARVEDLLKGIEILKNIPIVPIAINVKQRSAINVFRVSDKFPKHQSLSSALGEIIKRTIYIDLGKITKRTIYIDDSANHQRLFACIDKRFEKTRHTGEPAIRIKVLNGDIRIGDSAIIGPVKYNNQVCNMTGSVRSLQYESNHRRVNVLSKNHIGGVIFSRLQNGRDVIDLMDINLLNTSVIMGAGSEYESGNLLVFSLEESKVNRTFFESCNTDDDVKLIWFGKIVILKIISFVKKAKHYRLCLMNTKTDNFPFYFQKDSEGNIIYKDYVLQYKKDSMQDEERFVRAHLHKVINIIDEDRKDVFVCLKGDYTERLSHIKTSELRYTQKNNITRLTIHNISGIELADILFKGDIDKMDISEVSV